jgi:DNA polymerase I-like protein with 3'-5' exonuclease and polymerase domains
MKMTIDEMQLAFTKYAMLCNPDELIETARAKGVDLHTFVASEVLKKPMAEVTPQERNCSKQVLFAWVFTRPTGLGVRK